MIISGGSTSTPRESRGSLNHTPTSPKPQSSVSNTRSGGEAVKALLRTTDDLTADELDKWCKANDDLSGYQRPKFYEFTDEFPRTNTGKLDRSALFEG